MHLSMHEQVNKPQPYWVLNITEFVIHHLRFR